MKQKAIKMQAFSGVDFHNWTYVSFIGMKKGNHRALFRCKCGNEKELYFNAVKSGRSKSCGCLKSEKVGGVKTHGGSRTLLYDKWRGMLKRCNLETDEKYPLYGGRGITVCDDWAESFSLFRDWAISAGYEKGLQIDRIDTNAGYSPENCRFVDAKLNNQNRRGTYIWFVLGERYESASGAGKKLGLSKSQITNMCCGYKLRGKSYPAKPNCYRISRYDNSEYAEWGRERGMPVVEL